MVSLLTLLITAAAPAFEPQPLLPGSPYVLPGHQETLTAIAFSPDAKKLASAGRDKNVKVWSLETGKELGSFKVGVQQINALGWSGDGKKLVVGDSALSVQLIDAETGKVLEQLAHPDTISQLALQPDGAAVAVAGVTDVGAVYDLPGGKKRFEFRGRTTQYSADGKLLLVASNSGNFALLDARTGKAKLTVPTPGELPMTAMTPDAKLVATWSTVGVDVKLWSSDGKSAGVIKGPPFDMGSRRPTVNGAVPLRDGKRVIVAGADGILRLYKVGTEAAVQRWPADRNQSLVVSGDETWLAVIDGTVIKLWKLPQ